MDFADEGNSDRFAKRRTLRVVMLRTHPLVYDWVQTYFLEFCLGLYAKLVVVSELMVFPDLILLPMGLIPIFPGNDGITFSKGALDNPEASMS